MNKILLIDPFSGTSGDMFLAALVDVGVPFDALRDALVRIPALANVTLKKSTVTRGVFQATKIDVAYPHEHEHRSLSDIKKIIEDSDLGWAVKDGAVGTFTRLAAAEAKVHGFGVEEVHFHEVGALDAIVDIVGAHVALDHLGRPKGYTRPLALGSGSTTSDHGDIPLPAPATLELLSGYPVTFTDRGEELVTPTGAAIVASCFTPLPARGVVTPETVGYGAGSREGTTVPNVLRAVLGTFEATGESEARVAVVTSTIDDMNPEVYGFLMEKLFVEGALDVYYNHIMMKKNRPGLEVTIITEEAHARRIADYLLSNTTTLGVRINREERVELERRKDSVTTPHGVIHVKVATLPGGGEKMSPEYESCKEAAERAGVPLLNIYDAARIAWEEKNAQGPKS